MTLGFVMCTVYLFGSMLSLLSKENLGALLAFGIAFFAESAMIASKMQIIEKEAITIVKPNIENDLEEKLLGGGE